MALMRLQKFLSAAGVCSRRKGEAHIKAGRVRVNGVIVTELGFKIDSRIDQVLFDDKPVVINSDFIYIALHKPAGYVTSCSHPGESVVIDLIDIPERVFPVGRLDKESTGLLLLTNDGGLHHRLSHPSFDHEKEYEVIVSKPLGDLALRKLAAGLPLMGRKTRPAVVKKITPKKFRIILKEGRNRQIRRMVGQVGARVIDLKRVRVANVTLGRLEVGVWRYLSREERRQLLKRAASPETN